LAEFDVFAAGRLGSCLKSRRADVLHAHTGHAVGLGSLAGRGPSLRFVATRRVDFPLGSGFFSRWKYGRLDALAVLSTAIERQAVSGGVPVNKITVIPSGIDPSGYPHPRDRALFRQKHGFTAEDLLVVTVGALVPHKDQATFLRAAARVAPAYPRAKFLILGEGPLRGDLETLARAEGLTERVLFLGHRPEVLEYTAMADLFVFSSAEEGLGTALLDALVIGVPTAATSAGGIPDLYGGAGVPELTAPGDPAALADNMRRVLDDPAEGARRVERGRERGRLFSVTAMADAYEKLYDRLLPQGRKG
jgi:glycosyltransferase involved in cell wall biosynthesis